MLKTNESCRTLKAIYKHKDVADMFTLHKTSDTQEQLCYWRERSSLL